MITKVVRTNGGINLGIVENLDKSDFRLSRAWVHLEVPSDKELARHGDDQVVLLLEVGEQVL